MATQCEIPADSRDGEDRLAGTVRPDSAAKGAVFLSAAQALVVVCGYAIHVVAARGLSSADYGRFVLVLSLVMWVKRLESGLILPGLRKIVSEDHRRLRPALEMGAKWYAIAVACVSLAFLTAAPLLGHTFGDRILVPLLLLAALEIPFFGIYSLGSVCLNALRRYRLASATRVTYAVIRAVGACALIGLGFGVGGAVVGQIAGTLAAAGLSLAFLLDARRGMPGVEYPPLARRVFAWTLVAAPVPVIIATLTSLDLWLVKGMLPDATAGIYASAFTLSRLPSFMMLGLGAAVFPRVSGALAEGNHSLARSVGREAMRFVILLFVPLCFLVAGSSSEILDLLFSARYTGADTVLAILMAAMSCSGGLWLVCMLLAAADRPTVRLILIAALLPLCAIINALLIPRFGMIGAATASLVTFAVGALVGGLLVYRNLKIVPPVLSALRCVAAGAAVYALTVVWPAGGWLLIVKLTTLALLYVMLLFVLGELQASDTRAIKRAVWK